HTHTHKHTHTHTHTHTPAQTVTPTRLFSSQTPTETLCLVSSSRDTAHLQVKKLYVVSLSLPLSSLHCVPLSLSSLHCVSLSLSSLHCVPLSLSSLHCVPLSLPSPLCPSLSPFSTVSLSPFHLSFYLPLSLPPISLCLSLNFKFQI